MIGGEHAYRFDSPQHGDMSIQARLYKGNPVQGGNQDREKIGLEALPVIPAE